MKRKEIFAALVMAAAMSATTWAAEPVKPIVTELPFAPQKILIVGNSFMYYNCGIDAWLGGLVQEKLNPKVRTKVSAIGRSNMSQQPIAELLDNARMHSHSTQTTPLEEGLLKKEIAKRDTYDLVLIQASRATKEQGLDAFYLPEHVKAIKAKGGTPALIIPWMAKTANRKPLLPSANLTIELANQHGLLTIPAGQAFEAAEKVLPDVPLIMPAPDNRHPTAAGSYLLAATIYAAIYGRNPEEASNFAGACEKPLAPEIRQKLCQIAWETVQKHIGKK